MKKQKNTNTNMNTDSYVQFPLYLLAYGNDVQTRMTAIMACGAVAAGSGFIKKQKEEFAVNGFVGNILTEELENVFENGNEFYMHKEIVIGMHVLKMDLTRDLFISMNNEIQPVEYFCEKMSKQFGESPLVRIKSTYAEEVMNGRGMNYRDFSILCAVYSVIGNKQYARITRDCIRARSMGYKKACDLFSNKSVLTQDGQVLLADRVDKAKPFTTDQIRYTLDKMEAGHFARVAASKREVYFSHRMDRDILTETLFALKVNPSTKIRINRLNDKELQSRIKERLHKQQSVEAAHALNEASLVTT
jgi:hypothetical protein